MAEDNDFSSVTEVSGEAISIAQLIRLHTRYCWAVEFCHGKDVVEVACGSGPGLGALMNVARSVAGGDLSPRLVEIAKRHYGDRLSVLVFGAEEMPFPAESKDVILLVEAIYYLPDAADFVRECRRVLRPGGLVLVVTVNPDVWGFHRSQFSHRYFGACELAQLFLEREFDVTLYGSSPVRRMPLRQSLLRPVKRLAVALGIIPRTMAGKRWLKRIVFGAETPMPAEIRCGELTYPAPEPISHCQMNRSHQVLHCVATLR